MDIIFGLNNKRIVFVTIMGASESKTAILKAAIDAFSTRGFNGVSIRDIAKIANVNHAIIRYHFGSKEDLWLAVFQHLMMQLESLRNKQPFNKNAKDVKAEFRAFTRARVAHFARNPELLKVYFFELIENGDKFKMMDMFMRRFYQKSLSILEEMQSVGLGQHIDLKNVFFILPSILGGRFLNPGYIEKDFDGEEIDIETVIDQHTDLVLAMVME